MGLDKAEQYGFTMRGPEWRTSRADRCHTRFRAVTTSNKNTRASHEAGVLILPRYARPLVNQANLIF